MRIFIPYGPFAFFAVRSNRAFGIEIIWDGFRCQNGGLRCRDLSQVRRFVNDQRTQAAGRDWRRVGLWSRRVRPWWNRDGRWRRANRHPADRDVAGQIALGVPRFDPVLPRYVAGHDLARHLRNDVGWEQAGEIDLG